MPLYEPNVPMRYTAPLLDYLRSKPRTRALDEALARIGIDTGLIHDPNATLGIGQFDALMTMLRQLTGRGDLGFELGWRISRESYGALGQAMARCASVDELLRLVAQYSRLMSPSFSLQYTRTARQGELVWRPAAGMSAQTLRSFYEIHVVSLYVVLRDVLGERLSPYSCWLPMPRPAHAARYGELPQLRARFGERPLPEVRTVLDARLLDQPVEPQPQGAVISRMVLAQLQGSVGKARQWSDWVRLMLREADSLQPTQAQLAGLLSISAHTLARYLRREGCSYRELASEMRHQRACALLREPGIGIAQIAHRLGYGDATNFSHAFRQREGCSPKRYRETEKRRQSRQGGS